MTIKLKARHDNFTDQFNRIFMVKMAMVAAFITGLNWFKDTITCIIPKTAEIDKGYVHQACWIQGFYVFRNLPLVHTLTSNSIEYYGIPKNLKMNGVTPYGTICNMDDPTNNRDCSPMDKTFYLQYQWFPFYIAMIGFLYYVPYILFRFINTDMISLKTSIKAVEPDIEAITKNYFNYQINPPLRMRMRLVGNMFVKVLYLIVNILAFTATDGLLNGDFKKFGQRWISWSKLTNEEAYDYTGSRSLIKPGEVLLPTFGICEVLELGKDVKHTLYNNHRLVCEISQNVLYQYVLIVLWFLFIFGMVVSIIGFIMQLIDHVITITCFLSQGSQAKKVYQALTLRECEYLEFIRKKSMPVYGKLIRKLKDERLGVEKYGNGRPQDGYKNGFGHAMQPINPDHPYEPSQKLLDEVAQL